MDWSKVDNSTIQLNYGLTTISDSTPDGNIIKNVAKAEHSD